MSSAVPFLLSKVSQTGIMQFTKQCHGMLSDQMQIRSVLLQNDLEYYREKNLDPEHRKAKVNNALGDKSRMQEPVVPIVQPQTESAHAYLCGIFASGSPIFDVVANPSKEDIAVQFRTLIENHSIKTGWARHIAMAMLDGLKHNFMGIEVDWKRKVTFTPETDLSFSSKRGKPREVIWEGNQLRRIDPYNAIFDTRVAPADIAEKGEFAGYLDLMHRIQLKQFINELGDTAMTSNVKEAFESGNSMYDNYYIPEINFSALIHQNPRATTNWLAWATEEAQQKIRYNNMYEVATIYARIIPSDFNMKVPAANTPQVWKFITVNNQVLIYAERQTNAHNLIPIMFGQPIEDGLNYQTKSFANNLQPMQDISSALWAAKIASARRRVTDRVLYDPSRIREKDINSPNPSAKIPVRPSAYGKPLNEAVYQFPFNDSNSESFVQEAAQLMQFSQLVSGVNPVMQGQFVKGNKTKQEFDVTMGNSNLRLQKMALFLEAQFFTPLKEIIKLNMMQYQPPVTLFSRSQQQPVEIDPAQLRATEMEFKVTDGMLPSDKVANSDFIQVLLQMIGSSEVLQQQFLIGPMVAYLAKEQGIDELSSFLAQPPAQAPQVPGQPPVVNGQPVQVSPMSPADNSKPNPNMQVNNI